jgi:DUF2934 family protein
MSISCKYCITQSAGVFVMPNAIAKPVSRNSLRNISTTPTTPEEPVSCNSMLDEMRRSMIAEAAYHIAERRGFQPGHEMEDWLHAEKEIDAVACAPLV